MSKRTLGKARGLNSIADPSDFKGSRGRQPVEQQPEPAPEVQPAPVADEPLVDPSATPPLRSVDTYDELPTEADQTKTTKSTSSTARKRRELSVPVVVAEAAASTGINPADLVMTAYRKHGDAIFAGEGGRLAVKGRQRLRISLADSEFDKISRLGAARGWNRSETVSVLLTRQLLEAEGG